MSTEAQDSSLQAIETLIGDFSDPNDNDSHSPKTDYSVGDVVRVNVLRKIQTVTRLARIRAINIQNTALLQILDDDKSDTNDNDEKKENPNTQYVGVEFFNWKVNNNTDLIKDGIINGTKVFSVKKEGYGAFLKATNIMGSALWTKSKSKKALKLKQFDHQTFIKAARFGSMPVIKHMLHMTDYPQDPSIITSADKAKGVRYSAICAAISANHFDIIQLLFDKHLDDKPQSIGNNDRDDVKYNWNNEYILPKVRSFKGRRNSDVLQSKDGNTKFYNASLFDKLCKDRNIKMLILLFEKDSWPVFHRDSYGLYDAVVGGHLSVVQLLLQSMHDPEYINLPLYRDMKGRTIIPQTNLNVLNTAISHHRLDIVKYAVTEWEYRDRIIKNTCIYHPTKPHILPTLLYTILDCHLHAEGRIAFTCECIELLTQHCDPIDIGLNWVCHKRLSEQENIIMGDISTNRCLNEKVLYINRTLCIGTLLSALVYKCQALWAGFRAYDDVKEDLRIGIERLITLLVQNGMDWNLAKYDLNIKNIILKCKAYPAYVVTDLDVDICDDEDFVLFFRNSVSKSIETFRQMWLDAFLNFYKEDKLMVNIFKWYVLDFVVPRKHILDSIKHFTIKSNQEKEEKEKNKDVDPNYIDWNADDDDGNDENS